MLVLTRKIGDSVLIGDDVEVRILDIRGRHVSVGIRAPRGTPVHRHEVWLALKEDKFRESESTE